ncbi:MAG: hypothetical protein IJ262_07940 [Clostridia bacterium]|nr:hypothetical protein [Clostridia bacterium]
MKTFLKTGKKALSVFMAVMMVLTAWVWVVPEKASAATAGNYKVKVWLDINDSAYSGDQTIYIDYYTNNGMGTSATNGTATFDSFNDGDVTKEVDNIPGFPYQVRVYSTGLNLWWSSVKYGINVYVTKAGGSSYSTLYTESTTARSHSGTSAFTDTVTIPKSTFPYVNTFPTATKNRDIYLPDIITSGRYSSNTVTIGQATDQYGVNYIDPETITVSGSVCGTTGLTTSKSGSVLTVTGANNAKNENGTSQTATVVAKWKSANTSYDAESEYRSKTYSSAFTIYNPEHKYTYNGNGGTVNMDSAVKYYAGTIGSSFPSSGTRVGHTFLGMYSTQHGISYETNLATSEKLTSSRIVKENKTWYAAWQANLYTITFQYKNANGEDITETTDVYYGKTVTPPVPPSIYVSADMADYDFKFEGWSPEVNTTVTGAATYVADYDDGTFVGADYSAVNEAIAAANAIKANYGTDYELKYTLASRAALDSAINAVVTGLGRTQQSTVDGYAQAINDAIAGLDPNKFDVIFLDKDGAILLYEKDVEYKEAVTAPSYSDSYYDSTNHYTFTGWDTDEYASVVDDLVIQPVFTAAAHTFTTETVPSTCVQKGATKHTCSCGYSYIDGETDYGDHAWETGFTTDLEPTCTVAGSKSIHCTLCDAQKDITAIDPLGHQWSSQSIAVEASCGKIGIMTKVCDDCGVCEHTIIPALEHDYAENVVAPTCTTKGYTEYTCQRADCGHSYRDNYTDVVAHSYGAWETVSEAHCGVAGVKKQTCTECGHINLDSIPALVHDALDSLEWVVAVPATCKGKGYQTKTCSKCNNVIATEVIPATNHNYTTTTTAATCTAAGETVSTCENCGDVNRTVIQPLGHDWNSGVETPATCTSGAYITYTCQRDGCGETIISVPNGAQANAHVWEQTSKEDATCEKDGSISYKCANCTATKTEILPKLGHSYGEWEVVEEATNDKDGQWKRVCANNEDHVEYITIPKGGHVWDNGTVTETATCSKEGIKVYTCTNHDDCGVTLEVTVPVAQHTVAQRENEATCTDKGSVEAYCSVCGKTFSTEEIPVVPHTLDNGTAVAPTCTTSGYTTYECTADGCTFTYNEYDASKPATGHDYEAEETIAPDCTTEGLMTYTCACGESYTEEISATGHSYVKGETTDADCTTAGTEVYTCACGDTYTKFIEAAKGHSWSEYTETQAATADKYGIKERSCSVCGEVEIAKIAPIGDHVFTETITTPASCEAEGEKKFTCSVHTDCSANYTEKIPATGHTEKLVYVAPTCTAEGSTKIVCETCNKEIEKEEIPALYHDFSGDGVVTVEASCEGTGVKTYTCKNCDETKTEEIPAKGHSLSTTVVDAKCDLAGSVVTECTECGDPTVKVTTVLAAKGHNVSAGAKVEATCEGIGYTLYECSACDFNYIEMNSVALNHDYSVLVDTVEATCKNDGYEIYKCARCDSKKTITLEKTGEHKFVDTIVAPTCTEVGFTIKACEGCGVAYRTNFVDSLGHDITATSSEATCTEDGGITYTCSRSGCGYSEFVKDENKPALGHDMGEWYFSAQEGGKYYYNKRDCGRDECSYYEYEMVEGSETEAQKYFKVTYVNEWVATNYYVAKDGTKLAYSDAQKNGNYKTETVAEIFVKEGAAAQFPNKVYPQRYPTKEFGGYKLSWEVKSGTQSAANVTSNMVLNAVFTGYDVYYQVDFANKDGSKLTTVETILHGHGAQYPFADPTTADNLHYKYEFSHWNRDYSEIYSSGTIVAIYDEIPKTYYVFFHGINGNVISEGTFEYATKPDCTPKDMSIASDYTYHYSFVGWQLSNGKTVNVNELRVEDPAYKEYDPNLKGNTDPEVYNKYMTDAEKGIIHLYAKYNKYPIRYNVRIAAAAYDGSPVPGAVVQIIDSNNNYAGGAELNENSEYIFNLTYSKTYTVTITANNAQLTFTINGEELVKSNQNGNIPTIRVQLPEPEPGEVAGDNDCGCLCHSFLGRIYVTVFNLIYRLFGKKVVCCPDMYAAHGDDLVYS